jgi:hypothetical protein
MVSENFGIVHGNHEIVDTCARGFGRRAFVVARPEEAAMNQDHSAAPLALPFSEFCERVGVSYQVGIRILAQRPQQLPRTFRLGGRLYLLRDDAERWVAALKAHARAA